MITAQRIAAAMGGEVSGNQVHFPTPGHSAKDRGTSVTVDPAAPDGFLVHVHNGGDPLAIKRDIMSQLGEQPDTVAQGWRVTGTYTYCDERGEPLYRTRRKEKPGEPKRFEAEQPDGTKKIGSVRRVLYRLPELIAADPAATVYLVEGERKADKLASWGFVATSIAFGAKSWRKHYADLLPGRTVAILPDNDDPGRAFASQAMRDLEGAGSKVVIVELPGLPEHGDVVDWPGTADDLRELTANALLSQKDVEKPQRAYLLGISAAALMEKQFASLNYVIPGLLAEGAFILAGPPKLGKSWLCYDFALAIASGRPVFGTIPITQGDVLYCALEDSERRLKSRLLKKGIRNAPERLTLVTEWPGLDDGCIAELEAWADAVERPSLIIIDVLKMVRGVTRSNETVYDADYRALTGLASFARGRGIAVLIVHHTRKMAAEDPLESISGTNGLTGASDGVMVLKRDIGTSNCLLYVRGRDVEESETAVRFQRDIGTWERLGAAEEVGRTTEREAILLTLRGTDKPLTARDISDILGKSYDAVRKTLARMAHAGEIEKEGRGLYTCPNGPNVPTYPQTDIVTLGTGGVSSPARARAGMILAPGETGDEPVDGF